MSKPAPLPLGHLTHVNNADPAVATRALAHIDEFAIEGDRFDMIQSCPATAAAIGLVRHALVKVRVSELHVKSCQVWLSIKI